MSNLSFENIDRWLFEYTEGNLSPEQVEQLEHFLSMHPEFQLDLDAWKSSKISAEPETAVNVLAFQKSTTLWPVLLTLFIALLGVGTFFYLYDFNVDAKYAQKPVDLDRIGTDNDFIFEGKSSVQSPPVYITKLQEGIQEVIADKIVKSPTRSSLSSITSNKENSANERNESVLTSVNTGGSDDITSVGSLQTIEMQNSNDSWDDLENGVAEWLRDAPELERVIASLNDTHETDYIATQNLNTRVSSGKLKSSFSKKAKSIFRKVQRMMDQPVALRNFKDPHYAIPNLSSYQANFGMAGTMVQHRFQATSRNQWVGRDNQQLMNRLAWDGYIHALRGGIGVDLNYNDFQDGSIQDMSFGLTYSPKFSVSRNVSFEPAVRFKMGVTDVNLNSGIIGSTIEMNRRNSIALFENEETPLGSQLWYRDMGVGALVNTKWFYAGLNLDNLGRHYNNFYSSDLTQNHEADLDFSAVFGTEYKSMSKDVTLSTYLYYQNFGQINEAWGGANIRWRNVQLGGAVSNNLDLGATGGIVFDRFTVHYNLDYLTSVVMNQRILSHQVTMRMLLKPSRMTKKFMNM